MWLYVLLRVKSLVNTPQNLPTFSPILSLYIIIIFS